MRSTDPALAPPESVAAPPGSGYRGRRALAVAVSATLFVGAVTLLVVQMREYEAADLAEAFRALSFRQVAAAAALTALYYAALSGYDALGFRYIGRSPPARTVIPTGMTAFAVSNNLGRTLLTGGTVRYRLYRPLGLSVGEFARLVAFCSFAPWIGFLAVAGIVFLAVPIALPEVLRLPIATVRPLGIVLLVGAAGYLLVQRILPSEIRIRRLEIAPPGARFVAGAVGVALLDWTLAAGAIEALLPPDLARPYWEVLAIYQIAHIGLVLSRIPGGLGVLESLMVLMLAPAANAPRVLAAMLAFRAVFFLVPLVLAVAWFVANEVRRRRGA